MKIQPILSQDHPILSKPVEWGNRDCRITGQNQTILFETKDARFPKQWSQHACDIVASKYFRKSDEGEENSVAQVINRMVGCWTKFGLKYEYFNTQQDAENYWIEMIRMMEYQMGAPNSPQWFNTGIFQSYGIDGAAQGHYRVDPTTRECVECSNSYEFPQVHACYIQSIEDTLVGDNGIMDLVMREGRLFKFGSGTGTNFSKLRSKGEPLNNGGTSGGLMAWLKVLDSAAGAIKSGGTTRRAAKMVCLDVDHPEIMDFIRWKAREEMKVQAMARGHQHLDPDLVGHFGVNLDTDFNGEAYATVSGQNANNSIRIPDRFFDALDGHRGWDLNNRSNDGWKTIPSIDIWNELNQCSWFCGDPGLQFDDIINSWNTCAVDGRINASNPCSEYMFLDDTACNLASLNLVSFLRDGKFDVDMFLHAVTLWTLTLEISVAMASYPSERIAQRSFEYRTLGLGFTNLGALLMRMGIPYGSPEAGALAAAISSLMTGQAYKVSAMLAKDQGPFERYKVNEEPMTKVLLKHAMASGVNVDSVLNPDKSVWSELDNNDQLIYCEGDYRSSVGLWDVAKDLWTETLKLAEKYGVRNAQVTCIAPTGTISFAMDCDTTGIEPEFSLVKTKTLSGGGSMLIQSKSVEVALGNMDFNENEIGAMLNGLVKGHERWHAPIAEKYKEIFNTAMSGLKWEDHVGMMAAVQPFVSGAISKTVNVPTSTTAVEIADIHREAWQLGIKSIAIYRDGCKLSQPLNGVKDPGFRPRSKDTVRILGITDPEIITPSAVPTKLPLPTTRKSVTHKFRIAGHSGFLTVGLYEDGRPGEVFIRMSKAGSTVHGMMESWGKSVSIALQYGVPVSSIVRAFSHVQFDPRGITENQDIPICQSVIDYVARFLDITFENKVRTFSGVLGCENPHGTVTWQGDTIPAAGDTSGDPSLRGPEGSPEQAPNVQTLDSPPCSNCGTLMKRIGTCYQCENCGHCGGCG